MHRVMFQEEKKTAPPQQEGQQNYDGDNHDDHDTSCLDQKFDAIVAKSLRCSNFGAISSSNRVVPSLSNLPLPEYTNIPLCLQEDSWDCGIACIQMCLRWLRQNNNISNNQEQRKQEKEERKWMLETIGAESIWTIDLVLVLQDLLERMTANNNKQEEEKATYYLFCSHLMDVNSDYSTYDYYQDAFEDDAKRVKRSFAKMMEQNLPHYCFINDHDTDNYNDKNGDKHTRDDTTTAATVNSSSNKAHTKLLDSYYYSKVLELTGWNQNCIAILLVDNFILKRNRYKGKDPVYLGHYVILCGMSTNAKHVALARQNCYYDTIDDNGQQQQQQQTTTTDDVCLVIRDPNESELYFILRHHFQLAWNANGTDNDIIFVTRPPPQDTTTLHA